MSSGPLAVLLVVLFAATPLLTRWQVEQRGTITITGTTGALISSVRSPARISRRLTSASGPFVSVGPDGRMVLAWGAYRQRAGEARIRTASGRQLPIRVVSRDLEEDTAPLALAYGQGVVAWNDRDPDVTHVRFARANGVSAFGPPNDALTAREVWYPRAPELSAVPTGLVIVGPGDRIIRSP